MAKIAIKPVSMITGIIPILMATGPTKFISDLLMLKLTRIKITIRAIERRSVENFKTSGKIKSNPAGPSTTPAKIIPIIPGILIDSNNT